MAKKASKQRSKQRRLLRSQALRAWEPLVKAPFVKPPTTDHDSKMHDVERLLDRGSTTYINNRYQVAVESVPPGEHGLGEHEILWISIKSLDGSARHDWRDFQQIKNELAGPDWEAIEVYPAEDRLVDTCNQFHLWCLPPESGRVPVGWYTRFVMEENFSTGGSQRVWEESLRPADLTSGEEWKEQVETILETSKGGE